MFDKMSKETIRVNGIENGTKDIIRSLRSITDQKGYFRDVYKINKSLNKQDVKISFSGEEHLLLNSAVPAKPSDLRTGLRNIPPETVFNEVPSIPKSNITTGKVATSSNSLGSKTVPLSTGIGVNTNELANNNDVTLLIAPLTLTAPAMLKLMNWTHKAFNQNAYVLQNILSMEFDDYYQFISRICSVLAQHFDINASDYIVSHGFDFLNRFISKIVENNILYEESRAANLQFIRADEVLNMLDNVRSKITDEQSIETTIMNLLEEFTDVIVMKLIDIAIAIYRQFERIPHHFVPFEICFDDILQFVKQIQDKFHINITDYVIILESLDVTKCYAELCKYNKRYLERNNCEQFQKCSTCIGHYSVT